MLSLPSQLVQPPGLFDEDSGRYICGEEIRSGLRCRGIPISPNWKCERHGGNPNRPSIAIQAGLYARHLKSNGQLKALHDELARDPDALEDLFRTDVMDELAVGRMLLIEALQDRASLSNRKQLIEILGLVTKVAKIAQEIRDREEGLIKREFMDTVIQAVTQAFTRANQLVRPSDRARIFMSEFANALPGNVTLNVPVSDDIVIEHEV